MADQKDLQKLHQEDQREIKRLQQELRRKDGDRRPICGRGIIQAGSYHC